VTEAAAREDALEPGIAGLLKRDPAGLVTAVVQDEATRDVLMVGWMDDLALHRTLTTGRTTFFSRSRGRHWVKGETSGHRQWVRRVQLDCDGDTVLVTVVQEGPACHTGDRSCFDARPLPAVVSQRGDDPPRSHDHQKGDDPLDPPKSQVQPEGER
jgi:phosphoribosyl-AMP cyclohydrolase